MFGILGQIFGNEDTRDVIVNGVDAVVYTEQEKAENLKSFLKLYEPFKLAQRLLALIFAVPYALAWSVTFSMSLAGIKVPGAAEAMINGRMADIVAVIIGFYFLGGVMTGAIGRNKK